jgi:hypothetical protein
MRDAWKVAALLLVAGCSSGNPLMTVDAGVDLASPAQTDLAQPAPTDLAMTMTSVDAGPFLCGTMTCGTGNVCCVSAGAGGAPMGTCLPSCGDLGVPVECRGPQNCNGDPCCLSLDNNVPTGVVCETTADGCSTMFTFGGNKLTGSTRLCNSASDCTAGITNPQYPDCCQTVQNGVTQKFCFSSGLAGFTMGQITCP